MHNNEVDGGEVGVTGREDGHQKLRLVLTQIKIVSRQRQEGIIMNNNNDIDNSEQYLEQS